MQKIFIQNLKDKFSDLYEIEYFYFNESLDVDAFFNNINSMSLFGNKKISINGKDIILTNYKNPYDINWNNSGCSLVLDCTGTFLTKNKLKSYFDRNIKKKNRAI